MYRVALVGHSNLPVFPSWGDVQVEVFKERGAYLTDLTDRRRFGGALFTTHWDCVVLFLGGNDIAVERNQDSLYYRHLEAFQALHTNKLIVTDLEPRQYNRANQIRFGITTREYQAIANIVNKKLKRYARRTANVELIHIPPAYLEDSVDGIHLSDEGQGHLIRKYKKVITAIR